MLPNGEKAVLGAVLQPPAPLLCHALTQRLADCQPPKDLSLHPSWPASGVGHDRWAEQRTSPDLAIGLAA